MTTPYRHSIRVRYGEVDRQGVVFNAHYMAYMDDALEHLRCTAPVPDAVRIDHGDRTGVADAKAVRLRPHDLSRGYEAKFREPALQVVPRLEGPASAAALRLRLVRTEEDVPLHVRDTDRVRLPPGAVKSFEIHRGDDSTTSVDRLGS